jgi:hypothetical protein
LGRALSTSAEAYRFAVPKASADTSALENRVYWCRYENAFGDGWETRNASRPEEELRVRSIAR